MRTSTKLIKIKDIKLFCNIKNSRERFSVYYDMMFLNKKNRKYSTLY